MSDDKVIDILNELDTATEGYPMHVRELLSELTRNIKDVHLEWAQEESTTRGIDYTNEDP